MHVDSQHLLQIPSWPQQVHLSHAQQRIVKHSNLGYQSILSVKALLDMIKIKYVIIVLVWLLVELLFGD